MANLSFLDIVKMNNGDGITGLVEDSSFELSHFYLQSNRVGRPSAGDSVSNRPIGVIDCFIFVDIHNLNPFTL